MKSRMTEEERTKLQHVLYSTLVICLVVPLLVVRSENMTYFFTIVVPLLALPTLIGRANKTCADLADKPRIAYHDYLFSAAKLISIVTLTASKTYCQWRPQCASTWPCRLPWWLFYLNVLEAVVHEAFIYKGFFNPIAGIALIASSTYIQVISDPITSQSIDANITHLFICAYFVWNTLFTITAFIRYYPLHLMHNIIPVLLTLTDTSQWLLVRASCLYVFAFLLVVLWPFFEMYPRFSASRRIPARILAFARCFSLMLSCFCLARYVNSTGNLVSNQ